MPFELVCDGCGETMGSTDTEPRGKYWCPVCTEAERLEHEFGMETDKQE